MHLSRQHVIAVAVAVVCFGLALDQGGYSTGFFAGAAFAVWWAVLACVVLRLAPRPVPGPAIAIGLILTALAGWTALSATWASDDGAVFAEVVRVMLYLGIFVLAVVASDEGGPRPWLAGLTIGLTVVAGLSLASRFHPGLGDGDLTGSRLSYPIGYWNGLGACAAFALILLAWQAAHGQARRTRSLSTALIPVPALAIFLSASRGGLAAALLGLVVIVWAGPRRQEALGSLALAAAATVPLIVLAHGETEFLNGRTGPQATSEGHWVLAATAALTLAIGLIRHRLDGLLMSASMPRRARAVVFAAVGVTLIALVVADNPINRFESFKEPPTPSEEAAVSGHFTSDNGSGRYQFWDAAIDAFGHEPLHGIGAGQYETWWNEHGSISWVLRDAHSLLLETAAELGIVGLTLILLFFGVAGWVGVRRRRGRLGAEVGALLALLAAGLLAASIDWMWELVAVFGPVVVAVALLTGGATAEGEPREEGRLARAYARRPLAFGIATGLVAWIALWCSADLMLTRLQLDHSRSAASAVELTEAADAANNAIALQPWAAEPRLQLGLVQEGAGNLEQAAATLRGAAERAPDNWQIWFTLGRVEFEARDFAAARAALAKARETNPRSPVVRRGVERLLLQMRIRRLRQLGLASGGTQPAPDLRR
jgi:hypothetical protein